LDEFIPDSDTTVINSFATLSSPGLHLSTSTTNHNFYIEQLFVLDILSSLKLLELKQLIIQQNELKHVDSPHKIRIWHGDKLLKKNTTSLKKQSVNSDTLLTLEILESEESTEVNLLLYVQLWIAQYGVFSPPKQINFNGLLCSELRTVLSEELELSKEDLRIIKYNKHNRTWQELKDDNLNELSIAAVQQDLKEVVAKPVEYKQYSVKGKPYILRDGDIIVIKHKEDDQTNDFMSKSATVKTFTTGKSKKEKTKNYATYTPREAKLVIAIDL